MDRFAQNLARGLLVAAAAAVAGCGSSGGGLITGSTASEATGITNDSPMARPIGVATTSARAQRCGFYFDPAKLRTSYLAYESKQSNAEQFAKSEKTYDATFKIIRERVSSDPDYCTDQKGNQIKTDLQRHLAGDFAPNFPQPKKVESCGFFGCASAPSSNEPFEAKKFWEEMAKKGPAK